MRRDSIYLWTLCLLLAPILGLSHSQAQDLELGKASLRVVVLDPNGAYVVGAHVRINAEGKAEQSGETNRQGEAQFPRLTSGKLRIHVEAEGFAPRDVADATLKPGSNRIEIKLEIAALKEEVAVDRDKQEKKTDPRGDAFTTTLTQEQIAQLPDDPDEFEAAIKQMAGPGATIRVNGFRGGKLPPKSQIRQIRFNRNPYSAEYHGEGFMIVDVLTKPGVNDWHGSLSFGFRDEALNARNAFAPSRGPEQYRRFGLTLDGPLWRNRTSLFLSADSTPVYDSKTIVAALPEGDFRSLVRRPSRRLDLSARVEHALTKTHTLSAEFQRSGQRRENLGVGDFDLPERAFSTNTVENILRVSDSGPLSEKLFNELRAQVRWQEESAESVSNAPAVQVLNAFNRGGAQVDRERQVRDFELADNVDFSLGKHSLRVGVALEGGSYRSRERNNANGTFIFSSREAFRALRPMVYTQRNGDPLVQFSQYSFGSYWQDDMRLRKNLTLSLGLRHEWQTNLRDRNNFAPRFGLAWSPFADGKTTFRAGAGLFYNWFGADVYEQLQRVSGARQRDIVVRDPGYPDPFTGGTPFQLPPSRLQRDSNLRMPYVVQASFDVERQLAKSLQLWTSFFYQRGVHLLRGRNINAPVPGLGRPDPTAGNITQVESTANSTLQMLNISLASPPFGRRFHWMFNYSLSKSINESDGPFSVPADNFNLRAERGPSSEDARHRLFTMFGTRLFGGLRLDNIFHARSATPYNIITGYDDNGDTIPNDRPQGVGRNSARGAAHWDLSTRLGWSFSFGENKSAGAGAMQRVMIRVGGEGGEALGGMGGMPGDANKRFHLNLYVQAFNLLNHANLINFTGVQTSPFFGQATAALPGRRLETGMRFSF